LQRGDAVCDHGSTPFRNGVIWPVSSVRGGPGHTDRNTVSTSNSHYELDNIGQKFWQESSD